MTVPIADRGYAHPEVLVSTEWVAAHLEDPAVRLLESDEDVLLFDAGDLPGAQTLGWVDDLPGNPDIEAGVIIGGMLALAVVIGVQLWARR